MYYFPGDAAGSALDEEIQDSQDCLHCVPDCARFLHTASPYTSIYHYPEKIFRTMFT
jgi:hypothetical protein